MARFDVDLGAYIREQRVKAELSMRQLARNAGVSNPYLSQVERGLRRPSAEILQQLAHALRISAEALYVRAGLLEAPSGDRAVVEAIQGDAVLSDRQKSVLLDIYHAFRTEADARTAAGDRPAGEPAEPVDQVDAEPVGVPAHPVDVRTAPRAAHGTVRVAGQPARAGPPPTHPNPPHPAGTAGTTAKE